jgi:hypothetical protein
MYSSGFPGDLFASLLWLAKILSLVNDTFLVENMVKILFVREVKYPSYSLKEIGLLTTILNPFFEGGVCVKASPCTMLHLSKMTFCWFDLLYDGPLHNFLARRIRLCLMELETLV